MKKLLIIPALIASFVAMSGTMPAMAWHHHHHWHHHWGW